MHGEGLQPEARGEREDLVLGGAHPLSAQFDRSSRGEESTLGAPAHPVTGLEDEHVQPARHEQLGRGEAGDPGPDDHDVVAAKQRCLVSSRVLLHVILLRGWHSVRAVVW